MIDIVDNWIKKAEEDLKLIENEFNYTPTEDIVRSAICFHAQQLAEKMLKAYLSYKKVNFKKTHDLELLLELCIREDKEFERLDTGNLTDYAIEVRYPDDIYIPSFEEAKEAYKMALKIRNFVLTKIS